MKDDVQNRPPRPLLWALFLDLCLPFSEVRKKMDFGRLWAGAGGRGGGCLKLQILQILQKIQHAMLPLKGVRRIWRLRPCRRPHSINRCLHGWRHYGTRDLWFCVRFWCIGGAWNRLGITFCEPGDALKNSAGPSDLQLGLLGLPSSILSDLGCNFRGLETSFFFTNRT